MELRLVFINSQSIRIFPDNLLINPLWYPTRSLIWWIRNNSPIKIWTPVTSAINPRYFIGSNFVGFGQRKFRWLQNRGFSPQNSKFFDLLSRFWPITRLIFISRKNGDFWSIKWFDLLSRFHFSNRIEFRNHR